MIEIIELSKYQPPTVEEKKSKEDWVEIGEGNNGYYKYLVDRYKGSPTNAAIINNIVRLLYGRGLGALDAAKNPAGYAQLMTIFPPDEVRACLTDLKMLGQGHLQVHYNPQRTKILKAFHIDTLLILPGKCNEEGEITHYWFCDDWTDTRKFPPKKLDAFGFGKGETEILCIRPYTVGMKYFSLVDYHAGLPYAIEEEEIANYHVNDTQNGFSGTKVVNFNNGETDTEKMQQITAKVKSQLTGSQGEKVIVSFNRSKENQVEVTDIALNDAPNHYQYLSEECTRKLMIAHNVTSPLIFGIASTNGFSSNADELKNSVILFDNMVIKPMQDLFIDAIQKILSFNKVSLKPFFKTLQPLEFTDLENTQNKEQVAEETGVEMSAINALDKYGHAPFDGWVLIDEYDAEDLDESEIDGLNKTELSLMQKAINLVKTGTANPRAKSQQDADIKSVQFLTRYRYTGKVDEKTRPFCRAMLQAGKLYRKEDIVAMSKDPAVNPGWGPNGADTYDIFLYKGGGNCHHVWRREVYASIEGGSVDPTNPNARTVGTRIAEQMGYKVRNPYQVNVQPKNLPNNGFLPK